jgi:hypothetical protein
MQQRLIIGSGLIIALTGALIAIQENKPVGKAIGGALGFTLLLGLLAAAGEGPAKVASGLAVLGATSVLFYEAIPLFNLINAIGSDSGGGGSGGIHGPWEGKPRGEMPH